MAAENKDKLKALQLTLDRLDKTYGKGTVMKLGDEAVEKVDAISSGSKLSKRWMPSRQALSLSILPSAWEDSLAVA